MRYYFDTNFILYLLGKNQSLKEKCIKFLEKYKGEYYISTLVVLESVYVLQKQKKDRDIDIFLDFVKDLVILDLSFEDILEASKIKNLQIFDALHYVLARKVGAKLVTFDKDFENLKGVIILE